MRFVDTIDEVKNHYWGFFIKKRRVKKVYDQLIIQHMGTVDLLREFIANTEEQISKWEQEQKMNPEDDFQDEIELFKIVADFFRLNGRLILIELDIITAQKYLLDAKTEYEYRFFARRIYTLLYEAKQGLADKVSNMYPRLKNIVDEKHFEPYEREKKNFHAFLKEHQTELTEIRNKNEAHKTECFESQGASIENMSVVKSIGIIQDGGVHLYNLNCAFMIVQQSLMKCLGDMAAERIKRTKNK